ncbi:MAG: ribosome small subunit-dependent GTPase A [Candidatus Cloacimonetes bacterium]|nr:ribosome small subunit-dependent GTPase A [Candidatus Cloacimonadota bacterium]
MEEIKEKEDPKQKEDELLETEYDKDKEILPKPGKRLRVKERKSKKSNTVLKRGRVLEIYSKNYYRVKLSHEEIICPLTGRLKIVDFNNRNIVVVGDYVRVDVAKHPRIEEIDDRKNSLKRFIDKGNKQLEVLIASNIDQVIITTSCSEPPINLNLVDRYLCAARLSAIKPVICINKIDIADDLELIKGQCQYYFNMQIKVIYCSAETGDGIEELKEVIHHKDSVFSGSSGTGKSSIINRIDPSLKLKTSEISKASFKGKHTTSSSSLIPWSFGGYLIDTPGIKTFGLHKNEKDRIPRIFPGFADWTIECRFSNCQHIREEGCRVLEAKHEGILPEERYQSYLKILSSLD